MSETLTIEDAGYLRTITLSRPDLLNRFDEELHDDFIRTMEATARDKNVRAVLLASTGKVFSAGGDFDMMRRAQKDADIRRGLIDDAYRLCMSLLNLPQPIVAAMHGAAMGLGATVVLACDAVVAPRKAMMADSHVNVGLVAGDGGAVVWPATAGALRARRHLLTGDPLTAEEAFALGMVTDLVGEPDETLEAARAIAERMAALPPMAVQFTKKSINRGVIQRAGEVLELSLAYEETTLASEDLIEAIDAFQEKRAGDYKHR